MEKSLLIKKIKNKFISKEEKFKDYYKKSYHTYKILLIQNFSNLAKEN